MKFKNYIETESGIKDTSTSPGTAGQLLSSTVAGTSWIDQNTISSGTSEVVDIQVKNISSANGGINLSKGDPVYIYGSVGASPRLLVDLADADSTATNNLGDGKMPCVGLLDQDLTPNQEGTATVVGKLRNLITNPIGGNIPSENDTVYVKSGGGLTLLKPTGSTNLIQNVGQVGRVSTSADGNIVVAALLRSNDVPNLTTGKIWVGSAANTTESTVVHLDETNERMGVRTTSPGATLEVQGRTSNTEAALKVTDSGDRFFEVVPDNNTTFKLGDIDALGDELVIVGSYGDLKFNASGSTTMTLDNNNRVGIGTTSPSTVLEVSSSGVNGIDVSQSASNATQSGRLFFTTNTSSEGFALFNANGTLQINSGGIPNDTSGTNRISIVGSSGSVGIGTTSPNEKLEVNGSVRVTGAGLDVGYGNNSNNFVQIGNGRTTNGFAFIDLIGDTTYSDYGFRIVRNNGGANTNSELIHRGTGFLNLNATQAGGIILKTNNTERLRVNSSGNVGIGTTSPQSKLQVNGGVQLSNDTATASATKVGTFRYYTSGNNSYVDMCMQTGASTYAWVNIVTNSW